MLNTFKISSYIILGVSIVLAAHLSISSFTSDSSIDNLLDSPGAYEICKEKTNLTHNNTTMGQNLLVKQAREFANRINPPEEQKKDPITSEKTTKKTTPTKKTTLYKKFKLLGTVVNSSKPQMSMALIDLPGTGEKWVFQGETVNRVVIDKVYENRISIKDGSVTKDLAMEIHESKVKQLLKTPSVPDSRDTNKEKLTPQEIVTKVRKKFDRRATSQPSTVHQRKEVVMTPEVKAKKASGVLNALESISKDKKGADEQEVQRLNEISEILKSFMLLDEKKKSPSTDK